MFCQSSASCLDEQAPMSCACYQAVFSDQMPMHGMLLQAAILGVSVNGSLRGDKLASESEPPSTATTSEGDIAAEPCAVQNGHHANGGPAAVKGGQSRLYSHSALHKKADYSQAPTAQSTLRLAGM